MTDKNQPSLNDLIEIGMSRRELFLGLAATGALSLASGMTPTPASAQAKAEGMAGGSFNFTELAGGVDEKHHVATGYDADILIRWGDPLFPDSPPFDPLKQTADAQKRQFGMNNDFLGFVPLQADGNRGLLCVHHEYAEPQMMFPGLGTSARGAMLATTAEHCAVEMASMGGSIVEIARSGNGKWSVVRDSKYNRRITVSDTPMTVDGPAAGHDRLKTSADPTGTKVIGTANNCAGGMTPWNTWLMTEENWHFYFGTAQLNERGVPNKGLGGAQEKSWASFELPGQRANWWKYVDRFNVDKEPNEPNRFGWIVEVDPLDPASTPVKHTALGRFRHEGTENAIASDGRIVVYSGDDDTNEFVYKFVSRGRYDPNNRAANMRLLSDGTLYVARFAADGTGEWLPLVHGQGALTAPVFASQADVMIDTRLAARAVGATPMDRPEDVEPGPGGRVILALTNNAQRKEEAKDAANPRGPNPHGHIIEMMEDGGDVAATKFKWSILVLCGDPKKPEHQAKWHPETTADGWFCAPDNISFDPAGRLWISTDQGGSWGKLSGKADGLYALEVSGDKRGLSRLFFRCPVGAEMCGPRFTADGTTLFLAVQHPSADGTADYKPFGKASSFDDPATRWPDFVASMPPRPAVVVVTKQGGGKIG